MKKTVRTLLVAFATCLFCSCENSYLQSTPQDQLVIEGWIENGHAPVVLVSRTVPVNSDWFSFDSLFNYTLRYAKVYIEHGGRRYDLTARLNRKLYLNNYFTSSELIGEVGESYTLHVEWEKYNICATCTIPEPTPIDTVGFVPVKGDSLFYAYVDFRNNAGEGKKYMVFSADGQLDTSIFNGVYMGYLDGSGMVDGKARVEIGTHNEEKDNYFRIGDVTTIKLARLDEGCADFWKSYCDVGTFQGTLIIPIYKNIKGNIDGALGYWAGYGVSTVSLELK